MIYRIIAFSIRNKLLIGLCTVALIAGGIWSMTKVPLDAVPDITNNQVQVITQSPNLGTEDIEQFITYPVELAMANLPGVTEIRSVSRFGLSLVTIVFEDQMGTYLPRQLVSEKLVSVRGEIPDGFGTPSMGPISTGLGEILQYTLEVAPEYEDRYTAADLRSMQDWMIRRQMAMVPGVVEINGFGGDIKQYEVAIDPEELRAMGLSITEVFHALEANNQNTGGAYIEKNHQANFIRGEGLIRSLKDIEHIVVHHVNGIPITIKDVATVQYGKAVKYGAFTKDGKGEAVGGMVLMLKGANSNDVINAVKARVADIQKSLPEGVQIEPFLDRSTLIASTTSTVGENLILGALIVIFVLIFLLGNWRAGIIVASTIPLSLLFAFILMHIFGVWANLMSLGAIDFGIIIDGAVIIVEGTVFLMHRRMRKGGLIGAAEKEADTLKASGKVMNTAFFGQLIVLLVFVPVLALEGIEGKMFKPMALTFIFAMVGVMLLCLTYVPMMSSWFIKVKGADQKSTLGDRLVLRLENWYQPLLYKALHYSKWIIATAVALLIMAVVTFSNMGAEFMPKLDEGDIAFHSILKPGSSLSETIATTTKIEQLLIDQFPEIKHVMCRIGVAEVPTDPMPMDIADCFIILHPEKEWRAGTRKSKLIDDMKEAVQMVPGINYEFTQPIEMRFNELITGVREDVAIKLFGDDVNVLADKAAEIGTLVNAIEGVADMKVEATKGLPQMTVTYDRRKVAQYGLRIIDLNELIQTAFAGGHAGVIFEGERRFDLVVRLDEAHRKSIDDLKELYVSLASGAQIPLKEVADISYQSGPMQVSRDNTNRRTYVGINVRGRDIQSLVEEIEAKLDAELVLPPGYYIRYGGAFENLQRATQRLQVLVPIALVLIFILIFFALKSISQTAMIYMAIPLAAIGGVFSLWLRGMPFSLSAGVGFIVLFGVAVLNGLVLISAWNELKEEGITDLKERIALGAKRRIRPILLTALTDVLGFLPMALSSSAGAEVQRPLATVVIGGMISATLLTLFVLPILYRWVENRNQRSMKKPIVVSLLALLALIALPGQKALAQERAVVRITTEAEALQRALAHNPLMEAAEKNIALRRQGEKTAYNIGKTDLGIQMGQYNSYRNDLSFTANQRIEFPKVYTSQRDLAAVQVEASELASNMTANDLSYQVRMVWQQLSYLQAQKLLLQRKDSMYQGFLKAATLRYESGESAYLEQLSAETQLMSVRNEIHLLESDVLIQKRQLQVLLHAQAAFDLQIAALVQRTLPASLYDSSVWANNPGLLWALKQVDLSQAALKVSAAKKLPDISFGYFNQSMIGNPLADGTMAEGGERFTGVQVGISVPLFFSSYKAQTTAAQLRAQLSATEAQYYQSQLAGQYQTQLYELAKQQQSLNYYQQNALPQANLLIENAEKSFKAGALHYLDYFKSMNEALAIRQAHLEALQAYNQSVIQLEYLIGNE